MKNLIECVPNFSEGRNIDTIQAIEREIKSVEGVFLVDQSSDIDHNRSVFTLIGEDVAVGEAILRAATTVVKRVDMSFHQGVHPRIGAVDVVPFIPLRGANHEDCIRLAARTAERLWNELEVPSYLYGLAAQKVSHCRLENLRRGGLEELIEVLPDAIERRPDVGSLVPHPTAGVCAVGVRNFLIAYNVELTTQDLSIAQKIARFVRESSGGLPAVKALGLAMTDRGRTQVSVNLTDFRQTALHTVFEMIQAETARLGIEIAGTELIGLIPQEALRDAPKEFQKTFHRNQILENRLKEVDL
ncbi:MAG: glutamate formimidoyltransferase [Solibacterales bacterium]|nr:glutamate formimidoyltransferase [Bryobacterales bacterium]|tara:strand:+ start:2009 stop:2911 length:903 start_codon:yes stop_codon:yes gene_type:complete